MFMPIMRMPGLVASSPPAGAITFTYEGNMANRSTPPDPITFAAASIGAAAAGRIVFVAVSFRNSAAASVSGVTLGGNAMTAVSMLGGDSGPRTGPQWFALAVAAGTAADIVVTYSGLVGAAAIDVYAVYGAALPVADNQAAGALDAASLSVNVDVPAGGLVLAAVNGEANSTVTWTAGVDEDFDFADAGGQLSLSCASRLLASADAAHAVSVAWDGGGAHHNGLGVIVVPPAA